MQKSKYFFILNQVTSQCITFVIDSRDSSQEKDVPYGNSDDRGVDCEIAPDTQETESQSQPQEEKET